jgi:hypothetical protein
MSLCTVLEATRQIENKKSAVLKPKQKTFDEACRIIFFLIQFLELKIDFCLGNPTW